LPTGGARPAAAVRIRRRKIRKLARHKIFAVSGPPARSEQQDSLGSSRVDNHSGRYHMLMKKYLTGTGTLPQCWGSETIFCYPYPDPDPT
jgi:hypothetical protein